MFSFALITVVDNLQKKKSINTPNVACDGFKLYYNELRLEFRFREMAEVKVITM
jgi:hypothetical protein